MMSRLDEIRARVSAVKEPSIEPEFDGISVEATVRWMTDWSTMQRHAPQDVTYLLTLVDEAREIIRGYERERTEPQGLGSSALWWLIRVEREELENG